MALFFHVISRTLSWLSVLAPAWSLFLWNYFTIILNLTKKLCKACKTLLVNTVEYLLLWHWQYMPKGQICQLLVRPLSNPNFHLFLGETPRSIVPLSVCRLSACVVYCGQTVQDRRWIGMWWRDLDWCHFRPTRSTLTPQMGVELIEGHNLTLRGTRKSWVGFRLTQLPIPLALP